MLINRLLLLGLIIDLGGVPGQERIGFRYWRDPGAFVQYNDIPGSIGRFCSFFTAFINAGYSYSGTEVVIISAAEASSPSTQIPKAARRVIYRIALFNCGSALIVGMLVPWTEPLLSGGTGNAASSPWVIAISNAGIKALPSIVNAVILTSAWSAGNSFVYVASRTLLGLAAQGHAPKFMLKVDKRGVPYWAVTTTLLLGPLAYLSVGSGGAVKAYSWLQSITALAGILAWGVLCLAYIRLHAAMKAQGISRDTDIPWKSRLQPYGAWFGMILSFVIVIFSGFTVFIKGNWDVSSFFANYISEPTRVLALGARADEQVLPSSSSRTSSSSSTGRPSGSAPPRRTSGPADCPSRTRSPSRRPPPRSAGSWRSCSRPSLPRPA